MTIRRWQWTRRRDRSMLNSAARVVLIATLAVVIQGCREVAAHRDRNADFDENHHHHHDHHHHGVNPAECENESSNCVGEHGEEADQHLHDHIKHDDRSHEDSNLNGEEPQDGHAHHNLLQADHHHHHHHRHHGDEEHLRGETLLLGTLGQGRSHREEEPNFRSHLGHHHQDDHFSLQKNLTSGVWLWAMGCSLLVSSASLVCLLLLPLIVRGGKPSSTVVDALAGFGAGCMLGDALLHQLPHAFSGGGHSHGHSNHVSDIHHSHEHEEARGEQPHGHSLQELSVGLAVLAGIMCFFLVEKIVRRTEELSVHGHAFGHGHHHHRVKMDDAGSTQVKKPANKDDTSPTEEASDSIGLRKRNTRVVAVSAKADPSAVVKSEEDLIGGNKEEEGHASRFVLSYLNLFSDGVHNFTDGIALGSAFLLYGTVGGWSRTLFLLAHELPQEVGDFGILLRSGFGVFEALAFNFLSALMALAGTALALIVGGNPGHSSLIEGFTAGGFIYIAVGAVMPDMHSQGNSLRNTLSQVAALGLGMGAAILISLAE